MKKFFLLTAALVLGMGLSGCAAGDDPAGASSSGAPTPGDELTGEVTVFAAASLKNTFTELADDFEEQHPSVTVKLSFAGSSDLATQINAGAPADVFAAADAANMDKVAQWTNPPKNFASNVLSIVVPPGNPAGISSLADLADPNAQVVICAPQVPCGAAADQVADAAGITLTPVSEESSVTDVLGKVTSGQADAGLVYVTDVAGAGDSAEGIDFPESAAAVNTYPIATLKDSGQPQLAEAFVEQVRGEQGQEVLREAGFGAP